jgi:RNA polymerase sigma-70 factor (ECF subfamily)
VAFIRKRAGGVVAARESAADLAQSVCREALEDLDRFEFRDEDSFRNWLFARAARKICNRYRFHHREKRDAAREQALEPASGVAELLTAFATHTTPSRAASVREEVARLESTLAELPVDQAQAVIGTKIAGLSYAEMAEQMGRSESSVRGLVLRGVARLAALLEPEDEA